MKISSWVTGHQVAEDNNHWDIGKIEENPMIPIDQFLEVIYWLRGREGKHRQSPLYTVS